MMMYFYFNPRARAGRDGVRRLQRPLLQISIHAPARGATSGAVASKIRNKISIHAPARGATWIFCFYQVPCKFQSTRPRGARPVGYRVYYAVLRFQSTRPRGARPRFTGVNFFRL